VPSCTSLISSSTQLVVLVIVVKLYHIHTGGDFVSRNQLIQGRYTSLLFQASLFTHTFPDLPYPPLINSSPNRFLPSLPLSLSIPGLFLSLSHPSYCLHFCIYFWISPITLVVLTHNATKSQVYNGQISVATQT